MIIRYLDLEIENAMIEFGLEDALREKTLNYKIIEDGVNLSIGETINVYCKSIIKKK